GRFGDLPTGVCHTRYFPGGGAGLDVCHLAGCLWLHAVGGLVWRRIFSIGGHGGLEFDNLAVGAGSSLFHRALWLSPHQRLFIDSWLRLVAGTVYGVLIQRLGRSRSDRRDEFL